MKFIIEVTDVDQIAFLEKVALENNLTSEQYATNIVTGWLKSQLRSIYVAYARTAPLSTLKEKLVFTKEV